MRRTMLVVAAIILAVVTTAMTADEQTTNPSAQLEVNSGTLWLYGQRVMAPYVFQRIGDIWYCNSIQVVPKPGRPVEAQVQELDDVGELLQAVSRQTSQLKAEGIEGLRLSEAMADLLRASSLVDSVHVLPDGNLSIWYEDSPYPVLHLMSGRIPQEQLTRTQSLDERAFEKLIEPLQNNWTVYYSASCHYLKVPPGQSLPKDKLPAALQREIDTASQSR